MKKFKEYQEEATAEVRPGEQPEPDVVYYAYKNGKVIGEYETRQEAECQSKVWERVVRNQEEIDQWKKNGLRVGKKAMELWMKDLRKEHSDINDSVFQICYTRAYDQGHSYGMDAVADAMDDEIAHAQRIIRAMRLHGLKESSES